MDSRPTLDPSVKQVKLLRLVDFAKIQEPLLGLLRNTDMDLQRQIKKLQGEKDFPRYRELTLLLIMLRFAANSYQALSFLLSDAIADESSKRLPRYVLVVPSVNRQIMDLWFSLVL
jgi:hypothetical protein